MTVEMVEKRGPVFPEPLRRPEDCEKLRKEVDVTKELGYVFEAIKETRRKLDGRVPLFGFVGAPWTLMAYMIEGGGSKMFTEIKRWIFAWPEESKALLQRITDVVIEFLARQVEAGAQVPPPALPFKQIPSPLTHPDNPSLRLLGRRACPARLRCLLAPLPPANLSAAPHAPRRTRPRPRAHDRFREGRLVRS